MIQLENDFGSINWSQDRYAQAYRFAAEAHRGQTYPGTDLPYLMHISFVSMEIIAALNTERDRDGDLAVQCALLHDVIEDTDVTADRVEAEFGEQVARGVLALTKDSTLAKAQQMQDSLHRIQQQPYEVWMVKLADRIANLAPPPHHWTTEKRERYGQEALEIHAALHKASDTLGKRLLEKAQAYPSYV